MAENVECVAAESVRAVGKQAYLSQVGKELAALYRAMPDLQTSSYGYDLDDADPNTVWLKIRQRGVYVMCILIHVYSHINSLANRSYLSFVYL